MPGCVTVTVADASVHALLNPGAVADTTVVPALKASNATPPVATLVEVYSRFTGIWTVTAAPEALAVFSCPTVGLLLVKVTVTGPAPLAACQNHTPVPDAFSTPAYT